MSNEPITISDVNVAFAVINEAKSHGVYSGEMPVDDHSKLTTASELVKLAQQAMAAGMNGDPIRAVMNAASQQPNPAPPAAAPVANPFDQTQQQVPQQQMPPQAPPVQAPPAPQPPAPPAPVAAPPQAPPGFPQQPPQPPQQQQAPPIPAPAVPQVPAPAPPTAASSTPGSVDQSQFSSTEPWPGFDRAKIGDIMANLESIIQNTPENARSALAHIWEYENANKRRQRLIGKLTEIAQNGVAAQSQAPPAQPAPPTPVPQPAAPQLPTFDQMAPPAAPTPPQPGVDPTPPFEQHPQQLTPPVAAPVQQPAMQPPVPVAPQQSQISHPQEFSSELPSPVPNGGTQKALQMINSENLPIPQGFGGEVPVLPTDFTTLTDIDIRRYQSIYNACQARAAHLASVAEGYASDAKTLADAALREYMRSQGDVKSTVTQIEAQAAALPAVSEPRKVQHEWSEVARQFKTLRDTYQFDCERLSRDQTARDNEKATVR